MVASERRQCKRGASQTEEVRSEMRERSGLYKIGLFLLYYGSGVLSVALRVSLRCIAWELGGFWDCSTRLCIV